MRSGSQDYLRLPEEEQTPPPKPPEVSLLERSLTLGLVWILIPVLCPFKKMLMAAPIFPMGLLYPLGTAGVVVGWTVYLVLGVAIMRSERRRWFNVFFYILVILLLFNVAGCHFLRHTVMSIDG